MNLMVLAPFILFIFAITEASTKVNLRHLTANKEFVDQLEPGQFEVVYPFQVRENNGRIGIDTRNYFLNATSHYQNVVIVIRKSSLSEKLKLILNLNNYLFFNETKFNKLDVDGESVIKSRVENCFYQGTVNGDSTSFVAISTCNGLRGVVAFENGTSYGLWPLEGGDRGRRSPHVLFKTTWKEDLSCGAVTQNLVAPLGLFRRKRDVTRQTKYVELALIGDKTFTSENSLNVDEAMQYMLEAVNIADLMLARDLNIRLSVVYLELWLDAQRVDIHNDIERTLSGVHDYVTGHIYHVAKDSALMFTSSSFASQDVVSSMFSSVCTSRAVGLVKTVDKNVVHGAAQFVAHAVGHILGIDHDSTDCLCPQQQPCVMNKRQSAPEMPFLWQFSKCSVARIHSVLQSGHVQCLLNRPFQESRLHQCGNGVVDGDEECDCGPRNECTDYCCDALTCTLKAHAQCASHQPCCNQCQLRKAGTLCRESRSSCDVPEYCDGESGDCPPDGHLVDGLFCGLRGHCWKGNCSDPEQQCKDLWGPTAQAAEEPCYNYNEKGLEYGNCGKNRNGEFKRCETENKRCGTLHCRNGVTLPVDSSMTSFNFQFLFNNRHVQCKAITNIHMGMVSDGTSCGTGSVCIQGVCLPLVQVSPPVHCPSNNIALQCSGHGDCTTTQKCICYDGWTGVACDVRSNVTRQIVFSTPFPIDSFPAFNNGTIETTTLLIILLLFGVCLVLLLFCLLYCYRRKSSADYSAPMIVEKMDESFPDDGTRVVKFGPMPSYREERRKENKNKLVYSMLNKINEADERETASLKSRESSSVVSVPKTVDDILTSEHREIPTRGIIKNGGFLRPLHESASEMIYAESLLPNSLSNGRMNSPCQSDFCDTRILPPLRSNMDLHSGYATDSEFGLMFGDRYGHLPSGNSIGSNISSRAGSGNMAAPLKLSNLHQIFQRKLENSESNDNGSECGSIPDPEPLGDRKPDTVSTFLPDPPPASADSGHPASIYDARHSPTLFTDNFKLDIDSANS